VKAMGPVGAPRAVVTSPDFEGTALAIALPRATPYPASGFPVAEIDVVRLTRRHEELLAALGFSGFRHVGRRLTASYQLDRYFSPTPRPLPPSRFRALGPTWAAYLQEPSR